MAGTKIESSEASEQSGQPIAGNTRAEIARVLHDLGGDVAEIKKQLPQKKLTADQQQSLDELRKLGGQGTHEEDIVHEGTRFVLPANLTTDQALTTLKHKVAEDEREMVFQRMFMYRPWDGAHAVAAAFKRVFGLTLSKETVFEFLGEKIVEPPKTLTINTGVDTQEQVPWGNLELPTMPGAVLTLSSAKRRGYGWLFSVSVKAPRKYRFEIEGIFRLVEEELRTNSIYRGHAIDGAQEAGFIDLSGVNPAAVTYSGEVQRQLEANIWSVLERTDDLRALSISLKRAVMLEGEFGTGKTLAAHLTAVKATQHGWTFIYARPGQDDLREVMRTATLYQPAVVFAEDMDVVNGQSKNGMALSEMLDVFDGISTKSTEIVLVTTTNHPENITPAMLRPGRLDAVIHIGALDEEGITRLIKSNTPATIDEKTDFDAVINAMKGYPPAFVKEASQRAVRYALVRGVSRDEIFLTTEDFVAAADDLRPQYELMSRERENTTIPPLDKAFGRAIVRAWQETELEDYNNSIAENARRRAQLEDDDEL